MKLMDAIQMADSLKPNAFTVEQKLRWLNELEGKIQTQIHGIAPDQAVPPDPEEKPEEAAAPAGTDQARTLIRYTLPDDEQTELLVPAPYDGVYWERLCAMIDYANGEYDKYAASQVIANGAYRDYAKWYIRTHPGQGSKWRWNE